MRHLKNAKTKNRLKRFVKYISEKKPRIYKKLTTIRKSTMQLKMGKRFAQTPCQRR